MSEIDLEHPVTSFSRLRQRAALTPLDVAELAGCDLRTVTRWESGASEPREYILDLVRQAIGAKPVLPLPSFRFVDLFAGIGGLRRGFEAIGGKCVFTCEWDRFAQVTYRANFPHDDHEITGDIRAVHESEVPEHDVLLAGFPCQPFSLAGVSKNNALNRPHGFADQARGTLFFEIVRILQEHRPTAFLLENVKNLQSHDGGRTFQVIAGTLDELGYDVSTRVLDARSWVPQHRERVFIVGFRKEVRAKFTLADLPIPAGRPTLKDVLHGERGPEPVEMPYTVGPRAVSPKYTLSDHLWGYLKAYAAKHAAKGNGFGCSIFGPEDVARTLSARYHKDGSEILIEQPGANPRRLTPRECARLMGFDLRGQEPMRLRTVSDTQAYRQFGNSVVVPLVIDIAKHMEQPLLGALHKRGARGHACQMGRASRGA